LRIKAVYENACVLVSLLIPVIKTPCGTEIFTWVILRRIENYKMSCAGIVELVY
jgi:hypothetical protein